MPIRNRLEILRPIAASVTLKQTSHLNKFNPNQNGNLVTATEDSLTLWMNVITITRPSQAKFFILSPDDPKQI